MTVLGIDTSCYTTSVAAADENGVITSCRKLLPVQTGARGLRQSEAVFVHMKQLPALYEEAMLIFLAAKGGMSEENLRHYHITQPVLQRFNRFVTIYKQDNGSARNLSGEFAGSYWYYYYFAARNEKD